MEIARGMVESHQNFPYISQSFLHSKGVIHRDLKSPNVLIDDKKVKLIDFGSARVMSHDKLHTKGDSFILLTKRRWYNHVDGS